MFLALEAVERERLLAPRSLLFADAGLLEPLRADFDLLEAALLLPCELDLDFELALPVRELLLFRLLRPDLDGIKLPPRIPFFLRCSRLANWMP